MRAGSSARRSGSRVGAASSKTPLPYRRGEIRAPKACLEGGKAGVSHPRAPVGYLKQSDGQRGFSLSANPARG